MFKIIKKTSAVWQHELNGQIIHLSSFGVVADISLQTFILRSLNGSYFPNQSVGIANIIVIDETDASVEETFATINELLNRLIELNYTPYITENSLQLTLQQVTDNGATTTNQITTGNLTIDEVGGGDPCINTNQSLADGSIISSHFDTDSEFGISVRFPATITGNRNIDYPDANGTIATEQWVLDNLPVGNVESVNGQTGVVVLDANDIGLGNVNNTSDLNKPISTATQTALDGKITLNNWVDISLTSTIIGWSAFTTRIIRYLDVGNAFVYYVFLTGTSNSTNVTLTIHYTPTINLTNFGGLFSINNGTSLAGLAPTNLTAASNVVSVPVAQNSGTSWVASGTKSVRGIIIVPKL